EKAGNMCSTTVHLSGAVEGRVGPPVGLVDIGVSDTAYFFRVALPSQLRCEIECDGKVHIEGVITKSGGILRDSSKVYEMKVQQLCPPGPFTVSFNLPGPVDPRLFSPDFKSDGILEGVVVKCKVPGVQNLKKKRRRRGNSTVSDKSCLKLTTSNT
ncbi:hypothetical protein RJ641_032628, partial [Dillenia turbinata]